ncbi:hypothetical protein RB653_009569 [Dictyostelium firmibasis]|uniref:Uncharacterized protein n=1 Tax=Dictyostelium firmibasis TaxID=79012 RepID=A0AAN7U299_9MYCE
MNNQIECDEIDGVIIGKGGSICQIEQLKEEYIAITTNYGIISSNGSTTAFGSLDGKKEFSLNKDQFIPSDIGYEYFFLRWGTNKPTIATLSDPFLNPHRFNIVHLNGTNLYSIQSTTNNSYLIENSNLLTFIDRKNPFYFIFTFFNKPCDNKNNINMELLYPFVNNNNDDNNNNNNIANPNYCSSIQYGNQLVSIKSIESGNYISAEGSMNAWDFGNKFIKTKPLLNLKDSNYFRVISLENKYKSFWSWNDTYIGVFSTILKNQKFSLEPVLNNSSCSKNCYYIKTGNGGYMKETIINNSLNGNLLNKVNGDKTIFLIQVLPFCSEKDINYDTTTSTTSTSTSTLSTSTLSTTTTTENLDGNPENFLSSSSITKYSTIIINIIIMNVLIVINI